MAELAKPLFDLALNTADAESHRAFWSRRVGLAYEEGFAIPGAGFQDRYGMNGAVLKICSYPSVPDTPRSGYRELIIARAAIGEPAHLEAPDGARLVLVKPGTMGVERVGVRMVVRDRDAHCRFFKEAFQFPVTADGIVAIGDGRILIEENSSDAPEDASLEGFGWRCLTLQIRDLARVHAQAVRAGAREAIAPTRLRDIARYSMIRDPDGNWIELSQRASLTGPLD